MNSSPRSERCPTLPRPRQGAVVLAFGLAVAFLYAPCGSSAQSGSPSEGQARPSVSSSDRVIHPPSQDSDAGAASFRFLPDGSPVPFDRNLVLSAAAGEERQYKLQISTGKKDAPAIATFVIDKRRPMAPRALPGTGLYRESIKILLSGEPGSSIFWSLIGPGSEAPAFVRYAAGEEPSLSPPPGGTQSYSLLCYSEDAAGNRSYPSRFTYRLAELGLPAGAPSADTLAFKADPLLAPPELLSSASFSELTMKLPSGTSLLLDIQPPSPPQSLDDFERISPEEGQARLRLPCPYAWQGELLVWFGILKDGAASYNPKPLSVKLSNPAEEIPPASIPEEPVLAADPAGRAAFAVFPSYDGEIFASVSGGALEGSETKPYSSPIALSTSARSVQISWYGIDSSGRRSATRSTSLDLPETLPDVLLTGIGEGEVSGAAVTLKPTARAELRYEISIDGSLPAEPSPSSPLFGDAISVPCPPGAELAVVLRYRAFSGTRGGEGRLLRFFLDRKPPEAPKIQAPPSAYTDKPATLSLLPGAGGKTVYVSISADGVEAPFQPATGSVELAGSDSGPVSYLVRAYDLDAAGNQSPEMKSLSFVVDKSSVYVASEGGDLADRGDGSPDRPFRSLDEALAAAIKFGKRSVNMRGAFDLRLPSLFSSDIALRGGFGANWAKEVSARAKITAKIQGGSSAFSQSGGILAIQKVDLAEEGAGAAAFISLADSSLVFEDSSLFAGGEGDLLLVSARSSRISVSGSRLKARQALACTVFSADSCEISISGSSISGEQGVRVFGAFDMDGGALSLSQSLVESRSDLGLSFFSLRSSSLLVDRSLIKAEGGSGFMRLGSFKAVRGEVKNSKILLSWMGPGTLFELSEGGPAFRHDTIQADSTKGSLRFFDVRGPLPEIWNSILMTSGADSELLRSDSAPGQGILVADCLWGFDRYLAGARGSSDLDSLNALNAASPLYSSKPIISEAPSRTFAAPLKSQAPLRPDSACVNAALPLESGYETDFSGHRRPGPGQGGPDIGADESTG